MSALFSQAELDRYADDLAARIDPDQEAMLRQAWIDFYEDRTGGSGCFAPPRRRPAPAGIPWPEVHINDAQTDASAMILRQLKGCSDALAAGAATLLNIRCDYGTGILPSLFGCPMFTMPREMATLPTAKPLGGGRIAAVLDAGAPDLDAGLGAQVFETGGRMRELLDAREPLRDWVNLYHPDLQGPIDVVELIWGSELFLAIFDEPNRVAELLELVTATYAAFMGRWETLTPPTADGYSCHWGLLIRGRVMIRNDSLMNLSPETYVELIRPHDQRLLTDFGGGAIHYCGRGDHFIPAMSELEGLSAVNLSQPHLNDMDAIYAHTVDRNIRLIGLNPEECARAIAAGRNLRGRVC